MVLLNDALLKLVMTRQVDPQTALAKSVDRRTPQEAGSGGGCRRRAGRPAPAPMDPAAGAGRPQRKEAYASAMA